MDRQLLPNIIIGTRNDICKDTKDCISYMRSSDKVSISVVHPVEEPHGHLRIQWREKKNNNNNNDINDNDDFAIGQAFCRTKVSLQDRPSTEYVRSTVIPICNLGASIVGTPLG